MHIKFLWKNPRERNHLEVKHMWEDSINADLKEKALKGLDWIDGSGWGQVVGCCEYGNELLVSIKCGEFRTQLGYCQLLKECVPWNYLVNNK